MHTTNVFSAGNRLWDLLHGRTILHNSHGVGETLRMRSEPSKPHGWLLQRGVDVEARDGMPHGSYRHLSLQLQPTIVWVDRGIYHMSMNWNTE